MHNSLGAVLRKEELEDESVEPQQARFVVELCKYNKRLEEGGEREGVAQILGRRRHSQDEL